MKQLLFLILVCYSSLLIAQAPDYYNDVNLSLTGANLKAALATKITNTHSNNLSYTPGIWEASKITDVNPENPNEVLLIYGYEDGTDDTAEIPDLTNNRVAGINDNGSGSGTWNREHVYSNTLATPDLDDSSGNGPPYADAHNLRPCNGSRNSSRGNRKFSNSSGTESGDSGESYTNYSGGNQNGWYPGDEWKGDVARMMMYMYLRYEEQTLPTNVGLGNSSETFDDMIDLFLSWNVEDPVSAFELQRNTYHDSDETYAQGNRNPFIDNPYFATLIWGGPQAEDKFGNVTDSENPTTPINVTSNLVTGTSFYLSWTASTDNAFVTGYKVFLNNIEVGTTSSINYNATGLDVSTSYTVTIKAYDPTGNISSGSSSIEVNTGADNTLATELYISEYIEGSSYNKALEIINYTGMPVNLSSYTLKKQTNGAGLWSSTPLELSGTLANGDVYVIANANADISILNKTDLTTSSGVVGFNGNDPIGLFKDDGLIDIIGVFDDSSEFGENTTLQRKFTTTSPTDTYDSNDWISLASDTFSRLGSHIVTGTNTFLEITDTDWNNTENWSFNTIPINGDDVIVNAGKTINTSQNISLGEIILENNSSLVISSGGSLIVSGTSSGNVTYNRDLATTNWYLVSSPFVGETYDDAYVTANGIASGAGSNKGIAPYVTSDDTWDYMQAGETATFSAGTGYSVKRSTTDGDISFTGTLNVADAGVDVVLDATGNRFNLLGNPYLSHVASATFLNEAAVSETATLWVWNQATGAYEVKTIVDAMVIAPAQGFFVKANAAGGTFNFAESNQAGSGGTFQRTQARPEMHLTLSNQSDIREAKIYYIENMTLGFDVGYEGELFNGVANPLAIYTHLVADSEGKNYQVQSLPDNDFEDTIIPLGINAISGSSISIEASKNNFPEGMNIYLEDKQDNSFTLLESGINFNTTLENDLSGIGRFYLHTTSSTMSTNDLATNNNLSIYSYNKETLRVVGVQKGVAKISIYNLLGQEVLSSSFQGNGVNDISLLPSIINGIYIVKITSENKITNKKIIIQ